MVKSSATLQLVLPAVGDKWDCVGVGVSNGWGAALELVMAIVGNV